MHPRVFHTALLRGRRWSPSSGAGTATGDSRTDVVDSACDHGVDPSEESRALLSGRIAVGRHTKGNIKMSKLHSKIVIAVRVALAAMVAVLGLTLAAAGTAGATVSGVTYTPTNCDVGTQVRDCPTTTSLMSVSPSTFQFGTIADTGGSATASATFTNTSGQTEQFSTSGGFSSGNGDVVTPTGCGNNPNVTLDAGQTCTFSVTIHIPGGQGDATVSPATPDQENYFAIMETVNIQGSSSGSAFYIPFYVVIAPPGGGGGSCPPGDTGTYPNCVAPPPTN